jgi:hypothetical protein
MHSLTALTVTWTREESRHNLLMAGFDQLRNDVAPVAAPSVLREKRESASFRRFTADSHKYSPSFTVEAGTYSPLPHGRKET